MDTFSRVENVENTATIKVQLSHCRFCAIEKPSTELLDITEDKDVLGEYIEILDFLNFNYVIDLSNKVLPRKTCEHCYAAFHAAFKFFKKVKQAQESLNVLYNAKIDLKTEQIESEWCPEKGEYTEIKIEPDKLILDDAESENLCESEATNSQIAESDNNCENHDHTYVLKTESLEDNKEENFDPLTQGNISGGFSRAQTVVTLPFLTPVVTQKQIAQNGLIFICKLAQPTFNTREHFDSHNAKVLYDATKNKECMTNLKTKTNLKNEASTFNINSVIIKKCEELNAKIQSKKPVTEVPIMYELGKHTEIISWEGYKWICHHCKEDFSNMSEVRNHSKDVHNICFGFKCADCKVSFRTFNPFIEHVRDKHYESLRLHCQYCNSKFESAEQCVMHTFSHWKETTVCEYCGEIFPNFEALERHKRVYRKVRKATMSHPEIVQSTTGSWNNYDWSCQDCWMRMPDVTSLRTHVRDVHNKCFAMRCVDCLTVFQDYIHFVNHVTRHRPHLLYHCHFCNMYLGENLEITDHVDEHRHVCHTCGQIFADNTELLEHIDQYKVRKVKGVPKVVSTNTFCDVCQKTYLCPDNLKKHVLQMHKKKRPRDYICQTCGKAFVNNSTLKYHTDTHKDKTEKCELCGLMFTCLRRLQVHAKRHLQEKPFTCDACGQSFIDKCSMRNHILLRHINTKIKPVKCSFCHKTFRTRPQMRNHEKQHTGVRPYSCKVCKRTFTHWGNCNKHMIARHGVTLAKTKYTARGRININSETGEPQPMASDENAEKWLNEITKTRKRKPFIKKNSKPK